MPSLSVPLDHRPLAIEPNIAVSEQAKPIRILLADDHPMMREGLRFALDRRNLEIVGEAVNGAQAIELFKLNRPDIALIDLQMPGVNGLQAIVAIREVEPRAALIALTTYADDAQVLPALAAGASSYLLKSASPREIVTAIHKTLAGLIVLGSTVTHDPTRCTQDGLLTQRELAVIRLLACGRRNPAIARELNISQETLNTRIKYILAKLRAHDISEALKLAAQRGVVQAPREQS